MFLIPCIIIVIYAVIVATYFKTTFAKALLPSIILMITIVYLSGFLNNLLIGMGVLYLLAIIFIVGLLINYKNIRCDCKNIICDESILIFIIIYLLVAFFVREAYLDHWDEWSHWAPHAKDMFIRNKFYFTEGHIASVHISYPPLQAILQYIFARFEHTFNDTILYRAQIVLVLSIPFPMIDYLKGHKIYKRIFYVITIFVFYIATFRICAINPLTRILPDHTLGFLFTSLMIKSFNYKIDNSFDFFDFIMTSIALVLVKQYGLALFLGAFSVFLVLNIKGLKDIKKFIKYVVLLFIPIIILAMWYIFVRAYNVTDQFDIDTKISVSELINILFKHGGLDYQKETLRNFLNYLIHGQAIYLKYYQWVLLFIIGYVFLNIMLYKKYGIKLVIFSVMSVLGFIIYTFTLLCLYLFCFSAEEAIELASIWRYLSAYAVSIPIIIGYFMVKEAISSDRIINKWSILIYCMIFVLIVSILISKQKYQYMRKKYQDSFEYNNKDLLKMIEGTKDHSNILVLQEDGDVLTAVKLNYIYFNNRKFDIIIAEKGNRYETSYTSEEFKSLLKNFDYIYFNSYGDELYNRFGDVIGEGFEYAKNIYEINWSDNKLILEKIS